MRAFPLAMLLSLPPVASASDVTLPLGLTFCQRKADVATQAPALKDLSDDVMEGAGKEFGIDGYHTAVLDEERLVGVRFRAFDKPGSLAIVRAALDSALGAGDVRTLDTWDDKTGAKVTEFLAETWRPDESRTVSLKVQSEQIYVTWEVSSRVCLDGGPVEIGMTDQERADLEAVRRKKAIEFDPYAQDVAEIEAKKKAADQQREEADKQKREETRKKEESDTKDTDIDW